MLNILDIALPSKDWPPWSLANLLAHFMAIPRTDAQEVIYTFLKHIHLKISLAEKRKLNKLIILQATLYSPKRRDLQQEAISQKEILFRCRKDIQSLRTAGILIFCA